MNFFLILTVIFQLSYRVYLECPKHKIKIWSPVKCVAGRRFFVRISELLPEIDSSIKDKSYDYPWIVLIEINQNNNNRRKICTGVLINDRYIISSQHCLLPLIDENEKIIIKLGYDETNFKTIEPDIIHPKKLIRNVSNIILYPGFNPNDHTTSQFDLALLKFKPIIYSRTIYPIQLPTAMDKFFSIENLKAEYAEWNIDNNNGEKLFQNFNVKIIDQNSCVNYNEFYHNNVNSNNLCAISIQSSSELAEQCKFHTGGPLMIEKTKNIYNQTVLLGIVSWTYPKNKPCIWYDSPFVFVNILNKLDWIENHTQDALYCKY